MITLKQQHKPHKWKKANYYVYYDTFVNCIFSATTWKCLCPLWCYDVRVYTI